MKRSRPNRARFRFMLDGHEWLCCWDRVEQVLNMRQKHTRKTMTLSGAQLVDCATGQALLFPIQPKDLCQNTNAAPNQ